MLGVGAAVAAATPARADRIRVLPDVRAGEAPPAPGPAGADLRRFLEGVKVGEHRAYGGLSVLWLHGPATAPVFAIRTLDEARARGEIQVTERHPPTVSELVLENRGAVHVLVLAGEILEGGKQNRIVLEDVLAPPRSGPLALPVHCVEQGRWAGGSNAFAPREMVAAPQLRARLMEQSQQGAVWAEVDRYARRAAAPSATSSYAAVHDKAEVRAQQKDVEAAIGGAIAPGAHGAAVFVADAFVGLDLFQDGSLFAREWPKLLRAGTIETFGRALDGKVDERRLRARVEDLLKSAASTEGLVRRAIGVGWLVEVRPGRSRGLGLVAERQVVHAAIL